MKNYFIFVVTLAFMLPIIGLSEAPLGSRNNPVPVNTAIIYNYETMSFGDYEPVKGEITFTVVGKLDNTAALSMIYDLSLQKFTGSDYHCIKVLVEANELSRDVSMPVAASAFKAYDNDFLLSEILTLLSNPDLLNGTKAYTYLGFRTPEGYPGYLVFNDEVWFDLTNIDVIE